MNTLFQNARILLPGGDSLHGALGVSGERIAFAGTAPAHFSAERIIDCEGNILMPGLVNTHTHLPMNLFRSMADDMPLHEWLETRIYPLEEQLDEELCYWGSLLAAAEMIRGGVSACNDMYFHSDAIAQALLDSGMRALVAPCIVSPFTEEKEQRNRAFFARWQGAGGDRIRMAVAAHAEYTCDNDTLSACGRLAQELGVPFHIHVSETFQEHEACKERHDGKTPVQLLDSLGLLDQALLAHCVHVEMDDIARIATKGAVVLHNPQSNLKLGSGIAPIPAMLLHGCPIALGTDGAASNNNLDMFEEMRLAATLHKGVTHNATVLDANQALRMATETGARALGWEAGVLQAGSLADIIMVDAHQPNMLPGHHPGKDIVYSASCKDVLLNMVNGQVIYERGHYFGFDYEALRSRVAAIAEQLEGI